MFVIHIIRNEGPSKLMEIPTLYTFTKRIKKRNQALIIILYKTTSLHQTERNYKTQMRLDTMV